MDGLIDLHCHILPGVDDGAKDMAEALAMIDMARADGTAALVLTPHYRGIFRQNKPQMLREVFEDLRQKTPGMQLYLANEAGYERELTDKLAEGRVLTVGGSRYVLLELPMDVEPSQALSAVRWRIRRLSRSLPMWSGTMYSCGINTCWTGCWIWGR